MIAQPATVALIEQVTALQAQPVSRQVLAREALRAFLAAFHAEAGALLLYHPEEEALELAADQGLSESGRRQLESVRRGARGGWEIPLHGLLNYKAYIIERPQEHRLIPELIEPQAFRKVATIASIPLYRGKLPVGVLVVIAGPRPIRETEVLAHVLAFDVLAVALDPARRGAAEIAATEAPAKERAGSLVCEEWVDPRETTQRLEREIETLTEERRVMALRAAELEARLAESDRVVEAVRVEAAEIVAAGRAAAHERLRDERAATEGVLAQLRAELADRGRRLEERERAVGEQTEDRDRMLAEIEGERKRAREAACEAERSIGSLREEFEKSRAEAEDARAAHEREVETARTAHARQIEELTAQLAGEIARLKAERETSEIDSRESLARAQTLAATAERRLGEERAAAEAALAQVRGELAKAERRLKEHERTVGERTAERDRAIAELESERERTRGAVSEAEQTAGSLRQKVEKSRAEAEAARAAHAREAEELRAELGRQIEQSQAVVERERVAHAEAMEEAAARRREEIDDLRAAHRQEADGARAAHESEVTTLRTAHVREIAELQATLGRQIEQSQVVVESERTARAETEARAAAAANRADVLEEKLAALRSELAALRDDRERVLAAVADPGAEPAAVIHTLREQVVALEGKVGSLVAERAAIERRARSEAEAVEQQSEGHRGEIEVLRASWQRDVEAAGAAAEREVARLQEAHRREIELLRADLEAACASARAAEARAVQSEARTAEIETRAKETAARALGPVAAAERRLDEERAAAGAAIEKIRAELSERERALAERDRALAEIACERDAARRAARDAGDVIRGQQTDLERSRLEIEATQAAHAREIAELRAGFEREVEQSKALIEEERAVRAETTARASDAASRVDALGEEIARLRGELTALREDRERVREALGDPAAEPVVVLRALRERIAGLENREADLAAERTRWEEQLASAEGARAELAQRVGVLESELTRSEEMLESARRQLAAAVERSRQPSGEKDVEEATDPATVIEFAARVVGNGTSTAVQEPGGWRVLETDAPRREQVAAALGVGLTGAPAKDLIVANLLSAASNGLDEIMSAGRNGALLVGYAADCGEKARILGGIRIFASPPDAVQVVAALDNPTGATRRVILLSDDIDAFAPAKTALSKAGHSVSMACDARQASDLLAMVTPDAVLVDLRNAPEAGGDFLAALAPESGSVLSMLVCGDAVEAALARAMKRLLLGAPLDAAALAVVCRRVIEGPQTVKTEKPVRKPPNLPRSLGRQQKPKAVPRPTLARRFLSGNR